MKLFILPYKSSSESAKLLASSLNCQRIKYEKSRFRHTSEKIVINWGCSNLPSHINHDRILNHPSSVALASDKRKTFEELLDNHVPHPDWTCVKNIAQQWLDAGHKVYARSTVNGHSGAGITIVTPESGGLIDAPLYTKHFKTKKEYRVHVGVRNGIGSVIHIQQKRLQEGAPTDRVTGIRNLANGWIFACNNVDPLSLEAQQIAINGVQALGLTFGAVDLLLSRENHAVICEINTAPGLMGTTLSKYTDFFKEFQ